MVAPPAASPPPAEHAAVPPARPSAAATLESLGVGTTGSAAFGSFVVIFFVALFVFGAVLAVFLTLGVVLWGRAHGWPLEWIIASHVFVRMPRAAFYYLRLRAVDPFRWSWDPERARYVLREAALVGLSGLFWVFYFRIDMLMLEWMRGPEAVGQYAAAYKFVELALLGSGLVMASLAPLLAER